MATRAIDGSCCHRSHRFAVDAALLRVVWELEHLIEDRLTRWNASDQPEDRLVVIDIDEASLSSTARGPGSVPYWPIWSRAL